MPNNSRRGFISLRTILALLVLMSIIPLSTSILTNVSKLKFNHDDVSDEIALLQLRRIMNLSYDIENYGDHLNFLYHDKTFELSLINNRLVLSPGYQMFLNNVDDLSFIGEGNVIYVNYFKQNEEYKTPLTYQNGIYLDDFYDYDDGGDSD